MTNERDADEFESPRSGTQAREPSMADAGALEEDPEDRRAAKAKLLRAFEVWLSKQRL